MIFRGTPVLGNPHIWTHFFFQHSRPSRYSTGFLTSSVTLTRKTRVQRPSKVRFAAATSCLKSTVQTVTPCPAANALHFGQVHSAKLQKFAQLCFVALHLWTKSGHNAWLQGDLWADSTATNQISDHPLLLFSVFNSQHFKPLGFSVNPGKPPRGPKACTSPTGPRGRISHLLGRCRRDSNCRPKCHGLPDVTRQQLRCWASTDA